MTEGQNWTESTSWRSCSLLTFRAPINRFKVFCTCHGIIFCTSLSWRVSNSRLCTVVHICSPVDRISPPLGSQLQTHLGDYETISEKRSQNRTRSISLSLPNPSLRAQPLCLGSSAEFTIILTVARISIYLDQVRAFIAGTLLSGIRSSPVIIIIISQDRRRRCCYLSNLCVSLLFCGFSF
jgi:hypothetical protein